MKLAEYDEKLVRKCVKEILVYDDPVQVIFKAGIDIDIARE